MLELVVPLLEAVPLPVLLPLAPLSALLLVLVVPLAVPLLVAVTEVAAARDGLEEAVPLPVAEGR